MRKTGKLLLLVLLIALLLSSCGTPGLELKNRLIVQAIGIDETKNGVRVTLQTLNTEMAGNPNSGANLGEVTRCLTVEGATVSEAISNAAKSEGKQPLLSQNRLIVFGRETAQNGLYTHLDYFVRNASTRLTVPVAVSDTTAEELVSASLGENVLTADSITDILDGARYNTNIVSQALYEFVNQISSDLTDAYIPVVRTEEEEGESKISMYSVGVFQDDRMTYELSSDDVTALMLLTDKAQSGYFSVENEAYAAQTVLKIKKTGTKIQNEMVNGKILFHVQVKMTVDISETRSETPFSLDEAYLLQTEALAQQRICEMIEATVRRCFLEQNSDPFGFGQRFWQRHPAQFKSDIVHWQETLPTVEVETQADVSVERVGNGVENL